MPEKGTRSTYSQAPVQVLACDLAGIISAATGFFYRSQEKRFLISNWHVFTGRDFITKDVMDKETARTPMWLELRYSTFLDPPSAAPNRKFALMPRRVDLYTDAAVQRHALWLEHPKLESECDVVAIECPRGVDEPEFMHNEVNRISDTKIPVKPGQLCFVIGFPEALTVAFGLPIWKSAYVASEPHYDVSIGSEIAQVGRTSGRKLPAFFLDGLTRRGMSGSPVFCSFTGMWSLSDPYENLDPDDSRFWTRQDVALHGTATQFVGTYSGRIPDKEKDAALGLCWREDVLEEICSEAVTGASNIQR